MIIVPIKTARDYDRTLGRIEQLMEAKPGTKAGGKLVDALPVGGTGKVQKNELRQKYGGVFAT